MKRVVFSKGVTDRQLSRNVGVDYPKNFESRALASFKGNTEPVDLETVDCDYLSCI
jgi:hypothetical protein